jgi:hypothetical protein
MLAKEAVRQNKVKVSQGRVFNSNKSTNPMKKASSEDIPQAPEAMDGVAMQAQGRIELTKMYRRGLIC